MVVTARTRRWQDMENGEIPLERLAQHYEAYNRNSEPDSPDRRRREVYSVT